MIPPNNYFGTSEIFLFGNFENPPFFSFFFGNRKNSEGNPWSFQKTKGVEFFFVFLGIFAIIIIRFI